MLGWLLLCWPAAAILDAFVVLVVDSTVELVALRSCEQAFVAVAAAVVVNFQTVSTSMTSGGDAQPNKFQISCSTCIRVVEMLLGRFVRVYSSL